jgi:hypothetical protein
MVYSLLLAVWAFDLMSIEIKIDEIAFRHDLFLFHWGAPASALGHARVTLKLTERWQCVGTLRH